MVPKAYSIHDYYSDDNAQNAAAQLFSDVRDKALAFMEGDSDTIFFGMFLDRSNCITQFAQGKKRVIRLVKENTVKRKGVLGIVDSDFDPFLHINNYPNNVFVTDTYDIESMAFQSKVVINKFLINYGYEKKISKIQNINQKSIQEIILANAKFIGLYLLLNMKDELGLTFDIDERDLYKFIDSITFLIQKSEFICYILEKNMQLNSLFSLDLKIEGIIQEIEELEKSLHDIDPWRLCRGHDYAIILGYGFKNIFGNKDSWMIDSKKKVEKQLNLAYEERFFQSTKLYTSLIEWQKTNPPYYIIFSNPDNS